MKQTCLTRAMIMIALIIVTTSLHAQVTIGSSQPPNKGALLDLKESNNNGANSTKGLGLPKVLLLKLTDTDISKTIYGATAGSYTGDHTGLIVYNNPINPCWTVNAGLYVWDGSEWQYLGGKEKPTDQSKFIDHGNGTGTLTDFEGNSYGTKVWNGKHWMVENLLSIRQFDGTFIDCGGLRINPGYRNNSNGAIRVYDIIPEGTISNYTNANIPKSGQSYTDFVREFGLLYTWNQAMRACPAGWHIPSNAEWNALATTMGGASTIGHQMKKNPNTIYKSVDQNGQNWTNSIAAIPNGFNAIPAGSVLPGGNHALSFSNYAYWWAASGNTGYGVYSFEIALTSLDNIPPTYYFSIRCVQD